MHLEILSSLVICIYFLTLFTYASVEANSVDPDQAAPLGSIWSGSIVFDQEASKTFGQMTKAAGIFILFWSRGQGPVEFGLKKHLGSLDAVYKNWTTILNGIKTI